MVFLGAYYEETAVQGTHVVDIYLAEVNTTHVTFDDYVVFIKLAK